MFTAPRTSEDAFFRLVASTILMFVILQIIPENMGSTRYLIALFVIVSLLGYAAWAPIAYLVQRRRRQQTALHDSQAYAGIGKLNTSSLPVVPLKTRSDATAIVWYVMFGVGVFLLLLAIVALGFDTHERNDKLILSGILLAIATVGIVGGIKAWRRPKNPARSIDLRHFATDNNLKYETDIPAEILRQSGAGEVHKHLLDRAYFSTYISGVYRGHHIAIANIDYAGYEGFIGNLMRPIRIYTPYMAIIIESPNQHLLNKELLNSTVNSFEGGGGVLIAKSAVVVHKPTKTPYDRFGMSELIDLIDEVINIAEQATP